MQVRACAVISEVMWAGSDVSTADEWLEIVAISSCNLSDWSILSRKSSGDSVMVMFEGGTILSTGSILLISNYSEPKSRLSVEADIVTSVVSLPNSKLFLQLLDGSGTVIDTVDDGVGAPFAGGKSPRASMERADLFASGSDKSNWRDAEESINFDEGEEIYGTPGVIFNQESSDSASDGASPDKEDAEESEESEEEVGSGTVIVEEVIPNVMITEVMANPVGKDDEEWVEIANFDEREIMLDGLSLDTGTGSKRYSFSGVVLGAKSVRSFSKNETGISLRNKGGVIRLLKDETIIDSVSFPQADEGISYGRVGDSSTFRMYCISTKGLFNAILKPDLEINIQSGEPYGTEKATMNLEAILDDGKVSPDRCHWNFGDGNTSGKCNPPSHTFRKVGSYLIELVAETKCGDEMRKSLVVEVYEDERKKEAKESEEAKEANEKDPKDPYDPEESESSSSKESSSRSSSSSLSVRSESVPSSRPRDYVVLQPIKLRYKHIEPELSSSGSEIPSIYSALEEQITSIEGQNDRVSDPAAKNSPTKTELFLIGILTLSTIKKWIM